MIPVPFLLVLAADPSVAGPDAAAPMPVVAPDPDDPWKRLKVFGEGRLRAEGTLDQLNGEDRYRGRFRFRIGADYQIADTLKAGARLSTISDGRDANNPHWDFGDADGFSGSEVQIDRFYLEWKPCTDWTFDGGKFAHVYTRPSPVRELAWDDDIQPAGVAAVWAPKSDGAVSFDVRAIFAAAGEVNQTSGSGSDPSMLGVQANLYVKAGDSTTVQLASSYSDWSSLANFTLDQGNTTDNGGFAIWDTWAGLTLAGEGFSQVTGFGQYFNNLDDDVGEDTGYAAGFQVGQTKGKGACNVFGAYYDLDANAVFSAVAQDDTPIAGTGTGEGMKGVYLGVQYFVLDNVSLKLWGMTSDVGADDDPYRIRFDIDLRFP